MYQDFSFEKSVTGSTEVLPDVKAFIQGVQIILLSRKGNFPYHPEVGMNVGKYLFDYLDDETIRNIKTELNYQISRFLPNVSSLTIKIDKIEDLNGQNGIGIILQSYLNNEAFTVAMAIVQSQHTIHIVHEVY